MTVSRKISEVYNHGILWKTVAKKQINTYTLRYEQRKK